MGKLNYRLKGTTLIEIIVSMVLIIIIMTTIFQSFTEVNKAVGSAIKPYAYFLVKQNLNSTNRDEGYSEYQEADFSVKITRNLVKYENFDELLLLEVKAINSEGKIIISMRKIVSRCETAKLSESKE
jgi:hypothetical protein